jgi:hypothetical protein
MRSQQYLEQQVDRLFDASLGKVAMCGYSFWRRKPSPCRSSA